MIIPGVVASAHGNTGSGGTGSPSNLPTPSDYVGSTFTNSSVQAIATRIGSAGSYVATPINASWQPSTTSGVTGYVVTVTFTDQYGAQQTLNYTTSGTSVAFAPDAVSINGEYTVTVAAITNNGVTGNAQSTVISTTNANGSTESSNTSALSSPATPVPTYTYAQQAQQTTYTSSNGFYTY